MWAAALTCQRGGGLGGGEGGKHSLLSTAQRSKKEKNNNLPKKKKKKKQSNTISNSNIISAIKPWPVGSTNNSMQVNYSMNHSCMYSRCAACSVCSLAGPDLVTAAPFTAINTWAPCILRVLRVLRVPYLLSMLCTSWGSTVSEWMSECEWAVPCRMSDGSECEYVRETLD